MAKDRKISKDAAGCSIVMDGKTVLTSDFVAVVGGPTGSTSLYYYTDIMTVATGLQLMQELYDDLFEKLTPDMQIEVVSTLAELETKRHNGQIVGKIGGANEPN